MKRLITTIVMLTFVNTVFPQTQTTLQDLGRLVNHTTVSPNVYNGSAVKGNYLYNAGDGNAYIYKLTDPKNPTYIKTIPSLTGVERLWIGENYLFVYTGSAIKIYDLTDPENPAFKADYAAGVDLHKVAAKGNYMFVLYLSEYNTHKDGSFEIVDITNPTSPQLKGIYKPSNYEGRSFFFSETANHVYVAHYNNASVQGYIREIDYTDPTNPTIVREFIIPGAPVEIAINGTTMFVLKDGGWQGPSKLEAYDLSVSPITQLASLQVSTERAWDMNVYDTSITVTLLESNGFKNYTWNATTKTFDNPLSLNIVNASQISWYMVPPQGSGAMAKIGKTLGGYWLYFYYNVLEKSVSSGESETYGYSVRLVEVKIWIEILSKFTLTMGIDPLEAEGNGCSVTPTVGAHDYNKDQSVNISATDNKDGGWIFDKWTGDVNSTNKQASLVMNNNKAVVGHFKELKLVVAGNKIEAACICDVNDSLVEMVTLSATAYGDDWIVSGIKLDASGNGNDLLDITEVNVMQGTNKLWLTIHYPADNGSLTATFNTPIIIPEGQTQTFKINYRFYLTQDELQKRTEAINFIVKGNANAKPQHFDSGLIIGSATGERQKGQVYNTTKNMFMKVNDAITDLSTIKGDEVILCPGTFEENVNVNKSITLRSDRGKETSIVRAPDKSTAISVDADYVTIKALSIGQSKVGVAAIHRNNLTIDDCVIDNNISYGIYLKRQNTAYIQNSIFEHNDYNSSTDAINLEHPNDVHIHKNTFKQNGYGIVVSETTKNTDIVDNSFDISEIGIVFNYAKYVYVSGNVFDKMWKGGILIGNGVDNRVTENLFHNTVGLKYLTAIKLNYGENNYIDNNRIYDCDEGVGIDAVHSNSLTVEKNTLLHCTTAFDFNICSKVNLLSNHASFGLVGVKLSYCKYFKIVSNKITRFRSNDNINVGAGLFLIQENNYGYVYGNKFLQNCTGIKMTDNNKNIRLLLNTIDNSLCLLTGAHLTHAENIEFRGNSFSGNHGAAIASDSSSGVSVSSNNFVSNDVGLINSNNNAGITANNNYWGGNAPGNNDYQGNVIVNNWLLSPVKLQTIFASDSKEVFPGETDTLLLIVQNIDDLNDQVQVTLSDDNNWLTGNKTFTGTMTDSTGIAFKIPFTVPMGTQADATNNVRAMVVSTKNQGLTASDTVKLTTYIQSLESLTLSPDSVTIKQGASYQFYYSAHDGKNNSINITPQWTTTASTISADGLLETAGIEGEVTVTVSDQASGKSSSVKCYVAIVPEELKKIILNPPVVTLNYGDSKLFIATGYNQFGFKSEFPKVWSATAGTIRQDGLYIADSLASSCVVTVSDTNHLVSATANVTIVGATDVEEPIKIPTDFSLTQNYPNPFNPSTKINYSLPYSSRVKISVYNILGQLVTELIEEEKLAGNYTITWDAKTVASGIYFCRIVATSQSKNFIKTLKMVLLK